MKKVILALMLVIAAFVSCSKEDGEEPIPPVPDPASPVVFEMDAVPYDSLSTYHFFDGDIAGLDPSAGVLPFDVITPLFSDYAKKSRFVWMPDGVNAAYVSDSVVLDFPDGAVLIKNFYYDHVQPGDVRRIIETRVMFKKYGEWMFANYVWNDAQTEATLDLNGSNTPVEWLDDFGVLRNVIYRIPSEAECMTCHKASNISIPIGPKPQNIKKTFAYPEGSMDQLAKWEAMGYLASGYPATIETVAKWDDASEDLNDRVRAYLDMNCSHCHSEGRHCDYRPMRFAWVETTDPANLGICVPPDDPIEPSQDYIVAAGHAERSMLYYRINSTEEAVRMPLLGRTLVHEEAVLMIEDWINSLSPPCD